jgi:hypothetical protein
MKKINNFLWKVFKLNFMIFLYTTTALKKCSSMRRK